jgi:hypothetical protein
MSDGAAAIRVRILVFEDLVGIWTARALEHDVVGEGRTVETAVFAVLRIIRAHIDFDRRHNLDPLSGFRAAPQVFWNAFARATPLPWASLVAKAGLRMAADISCAVAHERPRLTGEAAAPRAPRAQPSLPTRPNRSP